MVVVAILRIDETEKRGRHHGRGQGHKDHESEEFFRNDAGVQGDIQDNQFHKTSCVHQDPDRTGFSQGQSRTERADGASHKFGQDRRGEDDQKIQTVAKGDAMDVGVQSRKGKVQWEKDILDKFFNLFRKKQGEGRVPGHDQSKQECSEDAMDTDGAGHP